MRQADWTAGGMGSPAKRTGMCAIVLGAQGRVGGAFANRLLAAGFSVVTDPDDPHIVAKRTQVYLFDCAYQDGDPAGHVQRIAAHLTHWREYAGIFVPSSCWITQDSDYGRAKRVVEELVNFYCGLGANVVTDRIGYFPGDGIPPDSSEPLIAELVDGDALFARVMARLAAGAIART
jgi:NAD(P)-dependent dehydrogenase (short-subunit alcohol dehydrogenase family)